MRRIIWLFALFCLMSIGSVQAAAADLEGTYVGIFGFYRNPNLRAELRITKGGKKFEGVLTFEHFKESIGTETMQSRCEIKGEFDERFGTVRFEFKKWLGPPPNGEYDMGIRRGKIDVNNGLWNGEGFELARPGTPLAEQLLKRQASLQRGAVVYRQRVQKETPGQYQREVRKIEAREQEAVAASRDNEHTGRFSKAGGREDKCRALTQWVSRAYREYPQERLDAMVIHRRFDIFVNLFRDEDFSPVFGRPYDQTTKEWRLETYQKEIQPCLPLARRDQQFAQLLPFDSMIQSGFNYGHSGRIDPVTIFAVLKERRGVRQKFNQMMQQNIAETLAGYHSIEPQILSFSAYNPMWPSEIKETREALQTRRRQLGQRLVARWEREMEQVPATLEGARRIHTELPQYEKPLNELEPTERNRIVSRMESRIDAVLSAELVAVRRKLASLSPTDAGLRAWVSWSREFEATYGQFNRQLIADTRNAGWQTRDNLFQQHLPSWTAKIQRLPASAQGLADARHTLTMLFDNHLRSTIPSFPAYEAVVNRFRTSVLSQLESLIEQDRAATRTAKTWYAQLLAAKPMSGEALVRGVQRVRLRFEFRESGYQAALALPLSQQQTIVARQLAQLGIQVDPAAAAELVFEFTVAHRSATSSRRGVVEAELPVTAVWGKASLKAPVTVARADGFHRVLATLASNVTSRITIDDKLPAEAVEDLLQYLVRLLPTEAETRNSIPMADLDWRELLLTDLPRLNEVYAAHEKSAGLNAGGRKISLTGVTTIAPLDYGISPLNQVPALDVAQSLIAAMPLAQLLAGSNQYFNPADSWATAIRSQGWVRAGANNSADLPTPVHYLSAWSHPARFTNGESMTIFALMDQAALREPNCVVTIAGRPARIACLTAEEASVVFNKETPLWQLRQQADETVTHLFQKFKAGQ